MIIPFCVVSGSSRHITAKKFIAANTENPAIMFPGCNAPFSFNELMGLIKARYGNLPEALRIHTALNQIEGLMEFTEDIWDDIPEATFTQGFEIKHVEKRRIHFEWIGPAKVINGIEDKKMINTFVFEKGVEYANQMELPFAEKGNTYNLWDINPSSLNILGLTEMMAVQMWCPSTGKEYWLQVDPRKEFQSAKTAVASLVQCPIKNPDFAIRQGEVFTFFTKKGEEPVYYDEPQFIGEKIFDLLTFQT